MGDNIRKIEMGDNIRKTHIIPGTAGIHFRPSKAKWIPAWPFLETSPFGFVFAGMTISNFESSALSSWVNKSLLK